MSVSSFKDCWAVILSGGNGTRFWPRSRQKKPKQLLCITDSELTMLEVTLKRLDPIIPPSRRIIVTNAEQEELTRQVVGDRCHLVIPEPEGRNTAPALALAAFEVKHQTQANPKANMLSFHADHVIEADTRFYASLEEAVNLSQLDKLCLLGILPSRPATEYGYIKSGSVIDGSSFNSSYLVEEFVEKPNSSRAKEYLESGLYSWNSGIFIWKNQVLLEELKESLPKIYSGLDLFYEKCRSGDNCFASHEFNELYTGFESVSIDCGVLEKSKKIAVVASQMKWNDIGSWDSLSEVFPKDESNNLAFSEVYFNDSYNNTIDVQNKFVAVVGVKDLIVIEEEDFSSCMP